MRTTQVMTKISLWDRIPYSNTGSALDQALTSRFQNPSLTALESCSNLILEENNVCVTMVIGMPPGPPPYWQKPPTKKTDSRASRGKSWARAGESFESAFCARSSMFFSSQAKILLEGAEMQDTI